MWSHILRRPCGALKKLEEFNRKASVRSMAGRLTAIVRAPHGEQVRRAGAVWLPCGGVRPIASVHDENDPGGTRRTGNLRYCGGISAIFKRLDYHMQCIVNILMYFNVMYFNVF